MFSAPVVNLESSHLEEVFFKIRERYLDIFEKLLQISFKVTGGFLHIAFKFKAVIWTLKSIRTYSVEQAFMELSQDFW